MRRISKALLVCCLLGVNTIVFAQPDTSLAPLAASYNAFGFKLLAQTRQSQPGKNVFLSPVGLALALSMAAQGAGGETLRQMLATLQLTANTPNLNGGNQALARHFAALNDRIKLEIANSLWVAQTLPVKTSFIDSSQQHYGAGVANVDFNDPATATRINDWVNQKTHGKIPKMVQPPLGANKLILLDAIYFKGDWLAPFDKKLTRDLPFTLAGGETVTNARMSRTADFDYLENDLFQAVRLPYAGRQVNAYVFLPRKSLDDFGQNLSIENWQEWTMRFRSRKGTVELPRFKLENEYGLNDVLKAMGMTAAFTRAADFHGISDEPLHIDWIRQKTYVDVNEEGTEAAAVTGIGFRALAVHLQEQPFQLIVDRPFFLALCDRESGAILFAGAILDPRS